MQLLLHGAQQPACWLPVVRGKTVASSHAIHLEKKNAKSGVGAKLLLLQLDQGASTFLVG